MTTDNLGNKDNEGVAVSSKTRDWNDRMYNMLLMWTHRAKAHKEVAKSLNRRLASELTKAERQILKDHILLLGRVIDAVELDEELGA
jgi:hypothetical protein